MILQYKKNIRYSCVVDTNYTLSLYLLYMSEEDVKDTAFFVGNAIPDTVTSKLNYVIRFNTKGYDEKRDILYHRIEALVKWRFRYRTEMFAQDHLAFSSHIIGSNKYTLIEDAPNIFTIYKQVSFMRPHFDGSLLSRLLGWFFWGRIRGRSLGTNPQCTRILYTSENDCNSELLKGKNTIRLNLRELWEQAALSHRQLVLNIFSLNNILERVSNKKVILFSQPLIEDCDLTEMEVIDIYKPYIEAYRDKGIVIKPHPRDHLDYAKWFPNAEILDTPAPMQLLNAIGLSFNVAITICSTAVSSMAKDTEIIWIGSKVNPKIENVYGDLKCPVQFFSSSVYTQC